MSSCNTCVVDACCVDQYKLSSRKVSNKSTKRQSQRSCLLYRPLLDVVSIMIVIPNCHIHQVFFGNEKRVSMHQILHCFAKAMKAQSFTSGCSTTIDVKVKCTTIPHHTIISGQNHHPMWAINLRKRRRTTRRKEKKTNSKVDVEFGKA